MSDIRSSRRLRWWRWRRSALRRRSDIVEAWAGLVTMTVTAVVAPLVALDIGLVTDRHLQRTVAQQRAERHQVVAVVLAIHSVSDGGGDGGAISSRTTVRWQAPDASIHTAVVPLTGSGTPHAVRIWTDARGKVTTPGSVPPRPAIKPGLAVITGGALTVLAWCAHNAFLWFVRRRNLAVWASEWSRVSRLWGSGRAGN